MSQAGKGLKSWHFLQAFIWGITSQKIPWRFWAITKNVIFTFLTVSQLFVYIFSKFLLAAYSTFSGQYFMCTHFLLSSSQFCSRAIFSFKLEKAAILNFCLSSAMELSRDPKMYQNGPCPLGISKIYTILTNSKTLGQWILPNVSFGLLMAKRCSVWTRDSYHAHRS